MPAAVTAKPPVELPEIPKMSHIAGEHRFPPSGRTTVAATLLLVASLLTGVANGAGNLVPNPGFEDGDGEAPAHWSGGDPGPHGRVEWATEAHGGRRSLAQSVDDSGKAQVWWSSDVFPGQPGETYTLSLWYRCTNSEAGPPVAQIQQGGDGANLIDWNLPVSTTWTEFRQSFTLGPDNREIRVSLINYYRAGQTIYWDDIRLSETFGAAAGKRAELAIAAADPNQTSIADRPYELGDRKPDFPPSVMFSDLDGWTMHLLRGAEGSAAVSAQQRIWGEHCLRVTYQGGELLPKGTPFVGISGRLHAKPPPGGCALEIVPPEPIEIKVPFDAVQLWVNGDNKSSPYQPRLALRLLDGDGQTTDVQMDPVKWMYWFLTYAPVPSNLKPPVRFERLILSNITNPKPMDVYFDALAFIQAPKGPIAFRQWNSSLPFPTRADTILPSVRQPVKNAVRQEGGAFLLECATADGSVTYRYAPKTGTLSDVSALVPGEGTWQPLDAGGPVILERGPIGQNGVAAELVSAGVEDGTVASVWRVTGGAAPFTLTYALRPRGKSLVIDVEADRPLVSSFSAGRMRGAPDPRVFWVPYTNICRWPQPHVLISRGHFASVYFDWYNTESSAFHGAGSVSDAGVHIFDRAVYEPNLDGERHSLRERIFLTISNHFDEILFNIPNPPSPLKEILRTNVFVSRMHYGGGVTDYDDSEFPFWQRLKAYGVDHLTIRLHADFWRSRESFTCKDRAAPAKGGDEAAKKYLRNLHGLGYRVGLYTDYLLISPLSESWTPDMAALGGSGERGESYSAYFIKPRKAPELQAEWAPRIHEKFGTSASYCDQMTMANLGWIDFDPRVPGGTQQRTVLENWGRLLLNERIAHGGPCYSEGGYHALWAGLCDGSYAQTFQPDAAPVPDFALLKIHPLEADVGYDLTGFISQVDRLLAIQMVYGHGGMLWSGLFGGDVPTIKVPEVLRCYFMMQQLQYRYTMEPVASIRYFDGARLVDTDEALRSGAALRGQVLTTYRNGLTVAVNANRSLNWTLSLADRALLLPPYGWAAFDAGGFLEFFALFDGKRRDFVQSDPYVYYDGRGATGAEGGIEASGQVIVLRSAGSLRVIPVAPTDPVRLDLAALGKRRVGHVRLVYVTESGGTVSVKRQPWPGDGWLTLRWPQGAFAAEVSGL